MKAPARGFSPDEFHARTDRAQILMRKAELSALLLTTEPEVRYFTGFLTRFWESPTRPWFVVIPTDGDPIAIIPEIGAHLMGQTWIRDIRTWPSPDYADDGIGLLAETLTEIVALRGAIGVPSGPETHIRMPQDSWALLERRLGHRRLASDGGLVARLRTVKTDAEITKIRTACSIADRAFARVPEIAETGIPLEAVFRQFQALCLEEGADWVAYLAGGAGPGGYSDVISPATRAPLCVGDVLMLDTGVVWDGYFCDFDRNYALGSVQPSADAAYRQLIEATDAAFDIAKPGTTAAELFHAMDQILTGGSSKTTGRLGHGLGMQLTEWPSLLPQDQTVLEPGMVLTLEPGVAVGDDHILVHEENIVVNATGAEYLSTPALRDLPRLRGAK